uniref:Uncharacterized protein n=1 Tax=Arundo donax TaxID=35708 RepID=A0A0A9ENQ7_ARUDO
MIYLLSCSKANMMFAHSMSLAIRRLALARRGASLASTGLRSLPSYW